MANTHCNDTYCETAEEITEITITEKALLIGGYAAMIVALGVLLWYGASMGYYPDLNAIV